MARIEGFAALIAVGCLAACNAPVPKFAESEWNRDDIGRALPRGFLFGAATAAHQIEGGNTNSWTRWEETAFPDGRPHVVNGERSGAASASFDHFIDRDLPLLEQLGANTYRFSVEWSRIEPQPGAFDEAAAQQYRDFALALRLRGLEPMVTLFHFSVPLWFEDLGGFERRENLAEFVEFAGAMGAFLGAEVDLWCTVNEPNVYAVFGYIDGVWPPGKQDSGLGAEVMANVIEAHALATAELRRVDTIDADGDGNATRTGLAHHVRVFQPASGSTLDQTIAALTDDFFNESIVQAGATGRIQITVPGTIEIDRSVPGLQGSFDYLGVNYYTRDHVRADLGRESMSLQYVPEARPKNDLGWDVYPEGLYLFLKRFSALGVPMFVTENGIPDADGDARGDYLKMHLYAIERAIADGANVRGYYHWSLIDNFEWAEGFEPRFGLFTIDFADPDFTRCPAGGAETFQQIARNIGLKPGTLRACP